MHRLCFMHKGILLFFISFMFTLNAYVQNTGCALLCNVDFENQQVVAPSNYTLVNQINVPCWNTTATDQIIEVWGTGFQGVVSYSGNQFIELNANQVSTIYQDFTATAGNSVSISFAHRGRNGTDVISVEVGPVGGPYDNLGTFAAGNTNWNFNTVSYTFPSSPTSTYTIRFNSVSSAGGNITIGNFLDAISIQLPQPVVNYTVIEPSCSLATDGEITLIPSGGTPPYSYNWSAPLNATTVNVSGLAVGNYAVTVEDANGCTVSQNIFLSPENQLIYDTVFVNTCLQYTWTATNQTYTQSGIYSQSLLSVLGCDSLATLILSVNTEDSTYTSHSECESYTWNNQTYNQSGLYSFSTVNHLGCDSSAYLQLTILNSDSILTVDTSCVTYQWYNNNYSTSGLYALNYINQQGCDSISYLMLTIHQPDSVEINITACDNYTWNTNTYFQSGEYSYFTVNQNGCDSVTTLQLEINQSSASQISDTICKGDNFSIGNQIFNSTGIYSVIIPNHQGCDSLIQLDLIVNSTGLNSFILPNVFSPNADLQNDIYFIQGPVNEMFSFSFHVYNRWGKLIYETTDPDFQWSPIINEFTSGIYFYTLEYQLQCFNEVLKKNGVISIFN
jgi:gliding motility-associated-like protein